MPKTSEILRIEFSYFCSIWEFLKEDQLYQLRNNHWWWYTKLLENSATTEWE